MGIYVCNDRTFTNYLFLCWNIIIIPIILLCLVITTAVISVYSAGLFAHSNCYDLGECTIQEKESGDGITGDLVSEIFTNNVCGTCFYRKFVYLFISGLIQSTIPVFALYTILLGVNFER